MEVGKGEVRKEVRMVRNIAVIGVGYAWARDVALAGIPVLVLDRENPVVVVEDRLERIKASHQEKIKVWGGWVEEGEAPMPDDPVVMDWNRSCDPKPLVILDSFSAFYHADQNDAGLVRAFMHRCRRLADLGATVIVIHNDGKAESAKDYRGSSDFKAAIDIGFHVSNSSLGIRLQSLVKGNLGLQVGRSSFY